MIKQKNLLLPRFEKYILRHIKQTAKRPMSPKLQSNILKQGRIDGQSVVAAGGQGQ